MSLNDAVWRAYTTAQDRKWNRIYILLDIHGTIAVSNYTNNEMTLYPQAIEALRSIGNFPEIKVILWTSCYPKDIKRWKSLLLSNGIKIMGTNRSPIKNTKTDDFRIKPYFSLMIDDKAGFDPKSWYSLLRTFTTARTKYQIWRNK